MSVPHSSQDDPRHFDLVRRTTFGFRNILHWPSAVQRALFFWIAVGAEYLAATRWVGRLLDGLAWAASLILTVLTPHAAASPDKEPRRDLLRALVVAMIVVGILISLGGNAIFTYAAETFSGDDKHRVYYSQDTHNLIMYSVIAPAYMAASAAIIYCAVSSFSLTAATTFQTDAPHRVWTITRIAIVLSLIVLISGLVQVNYFNDNVMGFWKADQGTLKEVCRNRIFWFVEAVPGTNGMEIRLNSAGVYYLCMQFCHMAVIATALFFVLTYMFSLYRLGFRITPEFLALNGGPAPIREKLRNFSLLELSAKWLALILTVHIYIWGDSCLRGNENIRVTAMFLLALQLFVLATPRLLIEYRLLKCAAATSTDRSGQIEWPDLIDQRDKVMSTAVACVHFTVQLVLARVVGMLITFIIG